jgi:internalin A
MRLRAWIVPIVLSLGCDAAPTLPGGSAGSTGSAGPAAATPTSAIHTPDALHAALKAKNPDYNGGAQMEWNGQSLVALDLRDTGVADISPLAGLPLVVFFAENTKVTDLAPLKGMRLVQLSLSDTPVEYLGPLRGMPLQEVRLVNTRVRDVSPLQGAPLRELWLNNSPVEEIGALTGAPLISLTIEKTKVRDLAVVQRLPLLERLNLIDAPVTDLSPVAGLRLTRLVFTPGAITKGLDAARSLPALREIGPSLEQMGSPQAFWAAYDAGTFR